MKTIAPRNLLPVCAFPVLALILGLAASPVRANPITGDTITGDLTVEGGAIRIDNGIDEFEFQLGTNRIDFWHDDALGEWVWSYGSPPTEVMALGPDNALSLYDLGPTGDAAIVLNPGNPDAVPAIPPSITLGVNEVLTVANSPSLLCGDFVIRSSNNDGSNDSFLMEGISGGSGAIPTEGAGTRMMWYPEKAAFRAGEVGAYGGSGNWDDANIGYHSAAFGADTIAAGATAFAVGYATEAWGSGSFAAGEISQANGDYSVALGYYSIANGWGSVAAGGFCQANGDYSVGLGYAIASGYCATALGVSSANSDYSVAMGASNTSGYASTSSGMAGAGGEYSVAMGTPYTWAGGYAAIALGDAVAGGEGSTALGYSYAWGMGAVSMGWGSDANGDASTAMGESESWGQYSVAMGYSIANGAYSTAMSRSKADGDYSVSTGIDTTAAAYASMSIGRFNEARGTSTSAWQDDDLNAVLEVGIGQNSNNRKNAFTVLQDGTVEVGKDATDGSVPLQVKSDGSVVLAKPQGDISMGNYQ
jgi:hypothetical protein